MRHAPRALLAGWLGFAVAFLVACGGGTGLLTGQQASNLNSQLDQVSAALGAGSCSNAQSAASQLANAVESLPSSINPTLANNLRQGASTVGQLATRDCAKQTSTANTTSTPTNTTHTNTTTTASTPSTTTTTPTPSTPATTPTSPGTTSTGGGSGGAGLGGGSGNGAGSGGAAGNANGNGNGNGP